MSNVRTWDAFVYNLPITKSEIFRLGITLSASQIVIAKNHILLL